MVQAEQSSSSPVGIFDIVYISLERERVFFGASLSPSRLFDFSSGEIEVLTPALSHKSDYLLRESRRQQQFAPSFKVQKVTPWSLVDTRVSGSSAQSSIWF